MSGRSSGGGKTYKQDQRSGSGLRETRATNQMKPLEVLFVEDNAGDTLLQWLALEDSPVPVKFHLARDGEQALQLLHDGLFDLIVLDLTLPKLSGFDVLEQCQTNPVPIVVFTGGSDTDAERHALELGAREYVRKPAHFEAYKEAVRRIVQRWGQELYQTSGTTS